MERNQDNETSIRPLSADELNVVCGGFGGGFFDMWWGGGTGYGSGQSLVDGTCNIDGTYT